MPDGRPRTLLVLSILMLVALGVFVPGINWGLPSRAVDPFLFGDTPVWSGEKIADLAPSDSGDRGADVDANPIVGRDKPLVLNETDAQRAEIIRRYRLFSYQPDEMITFKSLAQIRNHRGDPRLYQYGGLWMYPVGAMLGAADVIGLVDLRGGREGQIFYLDHPEAFGRFYIVARCYTLLWGLVGVWAVFWIVRRMTGSVSAAAAGALAYTFMPVVVNMAHEAKPHLPGAVLMLLAVIAASKYVETGKRRWCLSMGAFCGAAFGMVLSALLVFAIIPVAALLRPASMRERLRLGALAALAGMLVYAITNPYVWINAIWNRELLRSNLENSTAMYAVNASGLLNALRLIGEGMSPVLAIVAIAGVIALVAQLSKKGVRPPFVTLFEGQKGVRPLYVKHVASLLAVPAMLVAVQFFALASGKPGEYARFALFLDIALAVGAIVTIQHFFHAPKWRVAAWVLVLALTAAHGLTYTVGFVNDSRPQTSRLVAARELDVTARGEAIGLRAEPAPYALPPVNLFDRRLILLPHAAANNARDESLLLLSPLDLTHEEAAGFILPSESHQQDLTWPFQTPISWADKKFIAQAP